MKRLRQSSKQGRPRPVMNVTPLVDVVLVLLIIFMVVIPAMDQGLNLEVPGIFHADENTGAEAEAYLLSMTADGDVLLDDVPLPPDRVEAALRAASHRDPSRRLVLRIDRGIRYGQVRDLYRVVQNVRFPGVSLRVNQRQDEVLARAVTR